MQISCVFLGGFKKKAYFCGKVERLEFKIMALAISGIPMLTGDEALAFRERAEETLKKRGSIDFSLFNQFHLSSSADIPQTA